MDKSQELLTKIGQIVVSSIPESCESAWVEADCSQPGVVKMVQQYVSTTGGEVKYFSTAGKPTAFLFGELKKATATDKGTWNKAKFTVTKEGKLNVDFSY